MGIRFKCHHCQAPLNIKTELANKRGVCPQCHGKFRIPVSSQELSVKVDEGDQPTSKGSIDAKSTTSMAAHQATTADTTSRITVSSASSDTPVNEATNTEPLYFVRPASGGEYGPATTETIELWISQRRVTGETLVCQIGSSEWKKAKEFFPSCFVLGL